MRWRRRSDLGYDVQKDFEPIGLTAEYPELLVVRKDFPANTLGEFVTYAKANAGRPREKRIRAADAGPQNSDGQSSRQRRTA